MNQNFKAIARLTDYEAARILANRDDAIRPYQRQEVPKMEYTKSKRLQSTPIYCFFREIMP
jgi:hypothetical protein